ncbi:MAG: hypothetical protein ACI90M_001500 [Candidatus Azotimanducaceae bacterium]|jgi:hypothetical protein
MIALLSLTVAAFGIFPQDPTPATTPAGPPQVAWQRTIEDALAVQKETGLPLLVVVNMDGEVFNERFAGTTYHDSTFIESTRNYVCVVASPDRHTERDYDALGNRIECPRFKGCTCSEHINIEPELFRKFFNGTRNAPRHVGVSTAGKVLFDRFLDSSMSVAINAIAKHEGNAKRKHLEGTDDVDQMFRRRDAMARSLLEVRYRGGNQQIRSQLLKKAATAKNNPVDLLRMGLRDPDEALVGLAAIALSKVGESSALIDIEDALARITNSDVREQLVSQLRVIGKNNPEAARMASHFEAIKEQFAQPWRNTWQASELTKGREGIEAELDRVEAGLRDKRDDDNLRLQLATAQAAFACMLMQDGGAGIEMWLVDAQRNAAKVTAEALQAEVQALLAITTWYRSDGQAAAKAAIESMAAGNSSREPDGWLAANFLDVLLQLTTQTAFGRAQGDSNASLRGEVARAQTVMTLLGKNNAGEERGLLAGISLLEFAGLRADAQARLEQLVERFPGSIKVHDRWRTRLLVDLGAERMRYRYAKHVTDAKDRATAQWYAGYAALIAAEQHTRDNRVIEAENAYSDCIERFLASASSNDAYVDTAHHYAVLALAGRAEIRYSRKNEKGAVKDLVQAAALRPGSLDEDDGLKRKPRAIAVRIHAALTAAGNTELAAQLADILP